MEDFIANSALLAGHLTQQCEKTIAEQRSSIAELQRAASGVGQAITAGKAELALSARSALREALSQEIPAAVAAIDDTSDRLRQHADQLQREQISAASGIRGLAWKSFIAITVSAAVVICSTAYIARSNVQRANAAELDALVLEALQKVRITACDGQPCVKLSSGQQRWDKNEDYILVERSQATDQGK